MPLCKAVLDVPCRQLRAATFATCSYFLLRVIIIFDCPVLSCPFFSGTRPGRTKSERHHFREFWGIFPPNELSIVLTPNWHLLARKHVVWAINRDKCLANAKRPCDCTVLCIRPKSSLCSCPHSICRRDVIRQRCAHSMHFDATPRYVSLSQYFGWKETISVLYFFGYFIADWLLYNFAAGSFHTMKLCSRLYSIAIEF